MQSLVHTNRVRAWLGALGLLLLAPLAAVAGECTGYKSAVVMDVDSGEVLFQACPQAQTDPASMVKMMVALMALEAAEQGALDLNEAYTVSAAASRIGGHQVYLKQGEVFPVAELLKAVMISSANDAAFAVAEHMAGSQAAFVERMNARAAELGMHDTRFHNVHGLPPDRRRGQLPNRTTAHDMAVLARALIRHPLAVTWATTRLDSFRDGSFQLLNTNHRFLRQYEGAQGLKTGYHPRGAGFSVAAVAERDGRQLVAVVLGAESSRARLRAVSRLLDSAFAQSL